MNAPSVSTTTWHRACMHARNYVDQDMLACMRRLSKQAKATFQHRPTGRPAGRRPATTATLCDYVYICGHTHVHAHCNSTPCGLWHVRTWTWRTFLQTCSCCMRTCVPCNAARRARSICMHDAHACRASAQCSASGRLWTCLLACTGRYGSVAACTCMSLKQPLRCTNELTPRESGELRCELLRPRCRVPGRTWLCIIYTILQHVGDRYCFRTFVPRSNNDSPSGHSVFLTLFLKSTIQNFSCKTTLYMLCYKYFIWFHDSCAFGQWYGFPKHGFDYMIFFLL